MSGWRDRYRQGSFRGVDFLTENHDAEGGRRVVLHELPGRDDPYTQDMGRRAKRFTVSCLVIGDGYMADRDRLSAALDADGPGTLVHPYLGDLQVRCDTYTVSESTDEGGVARFAITFVEAGRDMRADAAERSDWRAEALARELQDGAVPRFATDFDIGGLPEFVEDGGAGLVSEFAGAAAVARRVIGAAGVALRTYEAGLGLLDAPIAMVRDPLLLAQTVRGMVRAIGHTATLPIVRIRSLMRMVTGASGYRAVIGTTAARAAERANRSAFVDMVQVVATAEVVAIASSMRFGSYGEAVSLRDWLSQSIDDIAVDAADAARDQAANDLTALRLAMVRDISARGASLARLQRFTPAATLPALAIAHRLFGPDAVLAMTADITQRNRIAHPGFVLGGVALDVLTASEAVNG